MMTLLACACVPLLGGAGGAPAIRELDSPLRWIIETRTSATAIGVATDGSLVALAEGPRAAAGMIDLGRLRVPPKVGSPRLAVPVRGGFPILAPALEVVLPDGSRSLRLAYARHEIGERDGRPFLRIDLEDPAVRIRVASCFRVLADLDLIERWLVIENDGPDPVRIENAASASLLLDRAPYDLIHLSGTWGREFCVERMALTGGAKVLDARGMRFHHISPWYAVRPAGEIDEENGTVWFGTLGWSGNWSLRFERTPSGELQILGGISFWDTAWTLAGRGSFTTPVLVTGFCEEGTGGASRRLHRYILRHVLPAAFRETLRPVLYNSWYATTFDVNAVQQVALAKKAKSIGVELFVMDDGWFRGRKDDRAGLGDWTPDPDKFPQGLKPMIDAIAGIGMDFGIWVEPEMVNPDSDLHRAHPDWALQAPGRTPLESRNQLVLNMARDDVRDWAIDWLSSLLRENPIRFVKWDFNRDVAEADWAGAAPDLARELRIRYVRNVYAIHDEIRRRFPNVWLEGCAGGGGRVDAGILARVDQIWTSDNTNPQDRIFIQHGYTHAFPAKTMVSWTTDDDWRGARPSLAYRFRVAMTGVLGIGNDLRNWGESEMEIARREIALYKEIRPLVQDGDLYRLLSPVDSDRAAVEYVAEDRSAAVVFLYNLQDPLAGARPSTRGPDRLRLRGLDPHATYALDVDAAGRFHGDALMTGGIPWLPRGDYQAKIVRLHREPARTEE